MLAGPAVAVAAEPDPGLARACAEVRSPGGGLLACAALHPGRRALRLPPGTGPQPYGVIARGGAFVTAAGRRLPLSRELASSFAAGTAYATRVYRATVVDDEVAELDARMRVPARLVMERIFGGRLLVGRISRRAGGQDGRPAFATTPTLPLVIRLGHAAERGDVRGRILNAGAEIAVGRVCYRSLAAKRATNPLVGGYSPRVTLKRVPGMHAPFADQQVLAWSTSSSGMGEGFYPSLATLMDRDPLARSWVISQHGIPTTGPALRLRFARRPAKPTAC